MMLLQFKFYMSIPLRKSISNTIIYEKSLISQFLSVVLSQNANYAIKLYYCRSEIVYCAIKPDKYA